MNPGFAIFEPFAKRHQLFNGNAQCSVHTWFSSASFEDAYSDQIHHPFRSMIAGCLVSRLPVQDASM